MPCSIDNEPLSLLDVTGGANRQITFLATYPPSFILGAETDLSSAPAKSDFIVA